MFTYEAINQVADDGQRETALAAARDPVGGDEVAMADAPQVQNESGNDQSLVVPIAARDSYVVDQSSISANQKTPVKKPAKPKAKQGRGKLVSQKKDLTAEELAEERGEHFRFVMDEDEVRMEVAGLDADYLNDNKYRKQFLYGVTLAIDYIRENYGEEDWWMRAATMARRAFTEENQKGEGKREPGEIQGDVLSGVRLGPDSDESSSNGTSSEDADDEGETSALALPLSGKKRKRRVIGTNYAPLLMKLLGLERTGPSRKRLDRDVNLTLDLDTSISTSTRGPTKKRKKSLKEIYLKQDDSSPTFQNTFDNADDLYKYILQDFTIYKPIGNKKVRHIRYPKYFSARGDLYTSQPLCNEVIDLWYERIKGQGDMQNPKGVWNVDAMCSILRNGEKTLANKHMSSVLNKSGALKKATKKDKKLLDSYDGATGRFVKTDNKTISKEAQDLLGVVAATNPKLMAALGQGEGTPDNKSGKQRMSIQRNYVDAQYTKAKLTQYQIYEENRNFRSQLNEDVEDKQFIYLQRIRELQNEVGSLKRLHQSTVEEMRWQRLNAKLLYEVLRRTMTARYEATVADEIYSSFDSYVPEAIRNDTREMAYYVDDHLDELREKREAGIRREIQEEFGVKGLLDFNIPQWYPEYTWRENHPSDDSESERDDDQHDLQASELKDLLAAAADIDDLDDIERGETRSGGIWTYVSDDQFEFELEEAQAEADADSDVETQPSPIVDSILTATAMVEDDSFPIFGFPTQNDMSSTDGQHGEIDEHPE